MNMLRLLNIAAIFCLEHDTWQMPQQVPWRRQLQLSQLLPGKTSLDNAGWRHKSFLKYKAYLIVKFTFIGSIYT